MARMFRMTKTGRKPGRGELAAPFLLWTRVFDPRDRVRDPVPQDPVPQDLLSQDPGPTRSVPQNPGPTRFRSHKTRCAWGEEICIGPDGKNFQDDGNWSEPGRGEVAAPFSWCGRGSSTRETGSETRSHKIWFHKIHVRQARGNA